METKEKSKRIFADSKLKNTILALVAVALAFIGPTYVVYVMKSLVEYVVAAVLGFLLFLVGFVLLIYLFRERKTETK